MNIRLWAVRGIIGAGLGLMVSQSARADDLNVARADADRGATCASSHIEAGVKHLVEADMPSIAAQLGLKGTVKVRIDLDDRGKLQNASIAKSSGYDALDRSALLAVRQSSFSPEQTNCVGQSGSYAVLVEY